MIKKKKLPLPFKFKCIYLFVNDAVKIPFGGGREYKLPI